MPMIDMPIHELMEFQGRNPRPEDHGEYWERALKEMNDTKPEVDLVPAAFSCPFADCYDMYFNGVKGARIHAKLLRPKENIESQPALLQFHGYSGNSGDWHGKLGYVASGFTVAALDVRGQGGLSEDKGGVFGNTLQGQIIRGLDDPNPDSLLFRQIFLDTAMLAKIVMNLPYIDENRVGVMGYSQGGGLTLACASLIPQINRIVPVYPFLCDYRRVWEMDLAKDAYVELKQYFRRFDPRHEREQEIFTKLGYIDVQYLTERIRGKVMLVTGLMDTICPPSTQFAAYNKITSPKEVMLYPDFGHESLPELEDLAYRFMMDMKNES